MLEPSNHASDLSASSLNQRIQAVQAQVAQLSDKVSRLQLKDDRPPDTDGSSLGVQLVSKMMQKQVPQQIKPQSRTQRLAEQEVMVRLQNSEDRITKLVEERFSIWEETQRNIISAKFEKNQADLISHIAELMQATPTSNGATSSLEEQLSVQNKRLQAVESSLEDMQTKMPNPSSREKRADHFIMKSDEPAHGPDTNNIEMRPKTASVTVIDKDLKNDGIPDCLEKMEDTAKGEQVADGTHCEVGTSDYESGFEYEVLEQSIWDTSLFIFLPQVGSLGSIYVSIMIFMNAFTQLALCLIINDVFTTREISPEHVLAMRTWRVSFGHTTDLMNKFTYQSFTAKVCNTPLSTQMHTSAAELLGLIGEYLPEQEDYDGAVPILGPLLPYWEGIGMAMSLLAVVIWAMQISINIQKISHKRWAFKTLPVAARSDLVHTGEKCQFVCVSMSRKVWIMLVLFVELVVVVMLGIAGTFYIIRTLSMRDLLLNCSALSIVLQIDELFFTAMVPHRSRYLLTSLKPLPRPLSKNFKGMSWSSLFSMVLIAIVVTLSALELQSQARILEDTRHEICGGNVNFVARTDDSGVLTASHVDPSDNVEDTYYYKAMRSLVTNDNAVHGWFSQSGSAATSGVQGGPWSLMTWTTMGLDTTVSFWNAGCVDLLPVSSGAHAGAQYFLHMLQDVVKDYSIQDCTHVLQHCNKDTVEGVRTRAICPVSCGCNHAGPRLVLGGNHGCPNTCYTSEVYNASMWSRECEDLPLDSQYWSEFGKGFNSYLDGYMFWTNADGLSAEIISERGCNLVSQQTVIFGIPWTDLCEIHDSYMKPLTYACPVSCQCRARHRSMCPYTCGMPA